MHNYGRNHRQRSGLLLLVFFALGALLGALLSHLSGIFLPKLTFLTTTIPLLSIEPTTINFEVIRLVIGLNLNLNLLTILCIIIALLLYRKF